MRRKRGRRAFRERKAALIRGFLNSEKDELTIIDRYKYPMVSIKKRGEGNILVVVYKSFNDVMSGFKREYRSNSHAAFVKYKDAFFPDGFRGLSLTEAELILDFNRCMSFIRSHDKAFLSLSVKNNGVDWVADKDQYVDKKLDGLSLEEAFNEVNKIFDFPLQSFEFYFGKIQNAEKIGMDKLQFRKWDVMIDSSLGINDDIVKFLENVERKLRDFKFLCYGSVQVSSEISGALADYSNDDDWIRIGTTVKGNDFMRSFIHELGHRFMNKFFSSKQIRACNSEYTKIGKSEREAFQKGDIVKKKNGMTYEILGNYGRSKNRYETIILDAGPSEKRQQDYYRVIKNRSEMISYIYPEDVSSVNGEMLDEDGILHFPTCYSRTSKLEFFAEMFAEYIMGTLKDPLKSWMDGLLSESRGRTASRRSAREVIASNRHCFNVRMRRP